jgi:hypothetical protein
VESITDQLRLSSDVSAAIIDRVTTRGMVYLGIPTTVPRGEKSTRTTNVEAGFEIYRVMRFSGIKLGAGINQNW